MRALTLQLLAVCSAQSLLLGGTTYYPTVKGIDVQGVVIPASEAKKQAILFGGPTEFWTPTSADVKELEARLPSFLHAEALGAGDTREDIIEVRRRVRTYRRQYVGFVLEGKRQILLNAFPKDEEFAWKRQFIRVSDGGASYWTILYDVRQRRLHRLLINGVAWYGDPSNHTMERTAGSFDSYPDMKFHPQPAATRSPASRRSSYSR
jgi:hypothetical protein